MNYCLMHLSHMCRDCLCYVDLKRGYCRLSMLERYVSKLLDASFADSLLFWHYAMRHVPSPSLMCAKDYSSTNYKPAGTKLAFSNNVNIPSDASNPDIMTKVPTNSIPVYGYGAFPIGGHTTACFCGWTKASATTVLIAIIVLLSMFL